MKNVKIHPQALLETEEIGEGTNIWAFAHVMEGARIGKNCNIGDHCFVELGAGAILLAGITIGDYAMVGLGAVVLKDVPPYVLVRGNPARASGWVCRCGKPLRFDHETTVCATCGLAFRQEDGSVRCLDGQKS